MSYKGSYFTNQHNDYLPEKAIRFLDESKDTICKKFKEKIEIFKLSKINRLTTGGIDYSFLNGTVYTGSAGLALYYFISACKQNETNIDLLKMALKYIHLSNIQGRRISFLCGDAGILAISTVISYKFGTNRPENLPEHKTLAQRLMSLISLLEESPDELLYGKSGYLYALLFVNKYGGKEAIPSTFIEKVVNAILKSGKRFSSQTKSDSPLLWQWHDKIYFGAAHGMAGILYMLLQARDYINSVDIQSLIKPSLDWLISHRCKSGNFPSSLESSSGDRLVQWCHGAPGFVPLCLLAYQVFEEENYLKIAIQCGEVVWERGLCKKGYSICHGVSGNAYTFIQLYQSTKQPIHLYRACCFMEWCILERPGTELHHPDRPPSLFEGILGPLYLAQDIENITDAKFPGLCL